MINKTLGFSGTMAGIMIPALMFLPSCQPEDLPHGSGPDMTYSHNEFPSLDLQAYYSSMPVGGIKTQTTWLDTVRMETVTNLEELSVQAPVSHSVLKVNTEFTLPLLDSMLYNKMALTCFYGLGSGSGGKMYYHMGNDTVYRTIARVIRENAVPGADVAILIDKTASMQDDIMDVKNNLGFIISQLRKIDDVRLAIGVYGDMHMDGPGWWDCTELSHDFRPAMDFMHKIQTTGGGDFPESVYDGLDRMLDFLDFRPGSKRMILVVGDAPSLEPPASSVSRDQLIERLKSKQVSANVYPVLISLNTIVAAMSYNPVNGKGRKMEANVYPNPASEYLEITTGYNAKYTLTLLSSSGLVIASDAFDGNIHRLELGEDISSGTYFLRIMDSKTRLYETKKVVIQR